MGTLMQLLLESLRANVGEGGNDLRVLDRQVANDASGFILENVHVATVPYLETDDEEEEVNPLLKLLYNDDKPRKGGKPKNINKLEDHLVRLEKKVRRLERCIPTSGHQQRLWLAPVSTKGSADAEDPSGTYGDSATSSYSEEPDETGEEDKKHSSASPSAGTSPGKSVSPSHKPSRLATRPVRLEKEERSCFARLLFSRCWTGKDHAGWKVKRRCPTQGSLSCPCGEVGPCSKVKGNIPPIDKLKSNKPARNNQQQFVSEGKAMSKPPLRSKSKNEPGCPKEKKSEVGKSNTTCWGKIFPCFKEHVHGDCCCRCKSNPKLKKSESMKSSQPSSQHKEPSRKSSMKSSKRKSTEQGSQVEESGTSEETDEEPENPRNADAYSVLSPRFPPRRKFYENSLNRGGGKKVTSKFNDSISHFKSKKTETQPDPRTNNQSSLNKPTASFEILLHPALSNDEIPEGNVVAHQILKTLSTIHGPVKVEQKIVVQGENNAVVIVTHGEACECNLCCMLKGKNSQHELVEGLSPQVIKFSSKNGCNTLINHSDGCSCELCGVLDPVVTKTVVKNAPRLENNNLLMAADNSKYHNAVGEGVAPTCKINTNPPQCDDMKVCADGPQIEASAGKNDEVPCVRIHSQHLRSKTKTKNGKKKVKKCHCTKCSQRRRVERLKLRLKREIGLEKYNKIFREIMRCSEENECEPLGPNACYQRDSDDNIRCDPKKGRKNVSFSKNPKRRRPFINVPADGEQLPGADGESSEVSTTLDLHEEEDLQDSKQSKGPKMSKKGKIKNKTLPIYSMCSGSPKAPGEFRNKYERQFQTKEGKLYAVEERHMFQISAEEQKCFPPRHTPEISRKKSPSPEETGEEDEDEEGIEQSLSGEDSLRAPLRREASCAGRCRRAVPRGETSHVPGHVLLQEGAFPQKFVYWSPGSRSNMATAYSSDSYYVPDQDEFPIVNMECEEANCTSNGVSGGAPIHRVQIPVWFRMLPRNTR